MIGFFFPVVPAGAARIRVQLSAAHETAHIDKAVAAFKKIGEKYGILGLDKKGIVEKYGLLIHITRPCAGASCMGCPGL